MRLDAGRAVVTKRATAVTPRHGKAAVAQARDRGLILIISRLGVSHELVADFSAACPKHLPLNAAIAAIDKRASVVAPRYHKAAIGQTRDRRIILAAFGLRVHQKLGANFCAVRPKYLRFDARIISVAQRAAVIIPGYHKAAIGQIRDIGAILAARRDRVDQELSANFGPGRPKNLRLDKASVEVTGRAASVVPCRHKAAIGQTSDRRAKRLNRSRRVHQKLTANFGPVRIDQLRLDAGWGVCASGHSLIAPSHHKAAIGQAGDRGKVLSADGLRVNQKLAAHFGPVRAKYLRFDAGSVCIPQRAA